ncbi:MAG: YbaB/EbfC family nucleoid-associated protein [Clostridia bacterium]|nr:YbaB/EbfC family nucleoid-associated protein [Clostridia bacterium]
MAKNNFGGPNMSQLMKQATQMQQKLEEAQKELSEIECEGESGNGLVVVTLSGNKEFLRIKISPDALDKDDVEMLEDLIIAAYNDASACADEVQEEIMPKGMGNGLF